VSAAAETSACSTTRGGRAGVAIVSAAVKAARAFACEGHAHIIIMSREHRRPSQYRWSRRACCREHEGGPRQGQGVVGAACDDHAA
jgi:hypothetical protein